MKFIKKIIMTIFIILLFFIVHNFQKLAVQEKPFSEETAGLYQLSNPNLIKAASLGNNQSTADFLWIKLVLKIGEVAKFENQQNRCNLEHEHDEEHCEHDHGPLVVLTYKDSLKYSNLNKKLPSIFYNYIYTITEIDPNFAYPYYTAIIYSMFEYKDKNRANYWIQKAIQNNPEYWEFHFFNAFYMFQNNSASDSVIVENLKRSLDSPKSLRVFHKNMALNLLMAFNKKLNNIQKQIVFLDGLLNTIHDNTLKEEIQHTIEILMQKQNSQSNQTVPSPNQ